MHTNTYIAIHTFKMSEVIENVQFNEKIYIMIDIIKTYQDTDNKRFLLSTQFTKFTENIIAFLNKEGISNATYNEYIIMSQEEKDKIIVLILQFEFNKSKIDLTSFKNVIIFESTKDYTYGREYEY